MKTKPIITILTGLFASNGIVAGAMDPYTLEPCINGAVSASGMYATQAEEDTALAASKHIEQSPKSQVSASHITAPVAAEEVSAGGGKSLEPTWTDADDGC